MSKLLQRKYWSRYLHLLFFAGFAIAFFLAPQYLLYTLIIYIFSEIFGGNAGLHRYFGHRAFTTGPLRARFLRWITHHIGMTSVIAWVGHHRWHHEHSDTDHDIHSPTKNGLWSIIGGIPDVHIPPRYVKDLLTSELKWWHKNFFVYHIAVIVILFLIHPYVLIYGYLAPNFMCLLSGMFIAYFPHRTGKVKNSVITEIYTLGEGWHLFHHDNPREYRFSKTDVTGWIIHFLLKEKNV